MFTHKHLCFIYYVQMYQIFDERLIQRTIFRQNTTKFTICIKISIMLNSLASYFILSLNIC